MDMCRIQVYANAEMKRRIELAAAKHNLPVTSYCLEAITQQMREDEVLEQAQVEISVKPQAQIIDAILMAEMRTLRERIKARRGGTLIPSNIVEQVRVERDDELYEGSST